MNSKLSRSLRIVVIIVLSLTAAMTLLGQLEQPAWHFLPKILDQEWPFYPGQTHFSDFAVFISLAAGIYGVFNIVRLAKGYPKAYENTVIFIVVGLAASAVQFYYSLTLRGSTAPNNMRLYLTAITLVMMLALRIPGIWQRIGFAYGSSGKGKMDAAGGLAIILCGLVTITTPVWAAPTHYINGSSVVDVLFWPLLLCGGVMIFIGGWLYIVDKKTFVIDDNQTLPRAKSNIVR